MHRSCRQILDPEKLALLAKFPSETEGIVWGPMAIGPQREVDLERVDKRRRSHAEAGMGGVSRGAGGAHGQVPHPGAPVPHPLPSSIPWSRRKYVPSFQSRVCFVNSSSNQPRALSSLRLT